jgi:general secretion pathway protein G
MPTAVKILLAAALAGLVLMLLPALVVPSLLRHADRTRITHAQTDIRSFMTALASYKVDAGAFPAAEQGLRALREKPEGVKGWAGPYIQADVPKDPWGHDYVYRYPGEHGGVPDIVCYGADGQPGGDGINADIVSWEKS